MAPADEQGSKGLGISGANARHVRTSAITVSPSQTNVTAEDSPNEKKEARPKRFARLLYYHALIVIVTPLLGSLLAVWLAWRDGVGSLELGLLLLMYGITGAGIAVGFHRYLTHKSFEAKPAVRATLVVLGSMAAQGPVIYWSAVHRYHHAHSDQEDDIHSPNFPEKRFYGCVKAIWHAHAGWMLKHNMPNPSRYVRDLLSDPLIKFVNDWYYFWILLGLAIPTLLGWFLSGTPYGAFKGFLWGGLVRTFVVHHCTWSVNSLCHVFGDRPFYTTDHSRNNFWLSLPTLGESWHNNHHAFPYSAKMGLTWKQLDPGSWLIRCLEIAGLAWGVKEPSPEAIALKRLERAVCKSKGS